MTGNESSLNKLRKHSLNSPQSHSIILPNNVATMIAMLAQPSAQRAVSQAAKQQTCCLHRKRQLCVSRSSRTAAEELHALVHDIAAVPPSAVQTLLQPSMTDTLHALASGHAQNATESYSGDAQGIAVLTQLLEAHATPAQRQALATAAAAAAARPPQLSTQEEALLLLQEPLVSTALRRMRRNPVLALASYGSNPAVSRAVGLLDQVLTADQHTSRVVEFMATAAALKQQQQQHQHQHQTRRQTPAECQQQQHQEQQQHAGLAWGSSSSQRSRQPARMAVVARSAAGSQPAGTNSSSSSSSSAAGDVPGGRGAHASKP